MATATGGQTHPQLDDDVPGFGLTFREMLAQIGLALVKLKVRAWEAPDIAQETVCKLIERSKDGVVAANPAAYIFVATRNAFRTRLRSKGREEVAMSGYADFLNALLPPTSADDVAAVKEQLRVLDDPLLREIFALKYVACLDDDEVEATLGLEPGELEGLMVKLQAKFKKRLQRRGERTQRAADEEVS